MYKIYNLNKISANINSTDIVVGIVLGNNIDHNILTMFTYIEPSTLRLFMHI